MKIYKMRNVIYIGLLSLMLFACGGSNTVMPSPVVPEAVNYSSCVVPVGDVTLELVTWNLENFPASFQTREQVKQIILTLNPDLIALQEIRSLSEFELLMQDLEGWEGDVLTVGNGTQRLAFLYKTSELTLLQPIRNLFDANTEEYNDAFTSVRRPIHGSFLHQNGLRFEVVNLHLKCCNGSEDRRRKALSLIKEKIDTEWSQQPVVVLGDFNDELVDDNNVFDVFLNDPVNYQFTTLPIAQGSPSFWSYPSRPSHLDHILISDELFNRELLTSTLRLSDCFAGYATSVSDHWPVMIRLE